MERASQWIFSLEIPSDVTVHAAGVPFSMHKLPLASKSGYIRHLVLESGEAEKPVIILPDVPGGSEGFELAAKFCYGLHFDLTPENAATARCVAEYLDMSEKHAANNLMRKTEAYIDEVALKTVPAAIAVLHGCESFMPIAEKVKLVGRCIDSIAFLSCKESQGILMADHHLEEWWAEHLAVLRVDIFQRVLVAMMSRGFKPAKLGLILTFYAQKSLCCLDVSGSGARRIEPELAQEKRAVVETVTGLLPRENAAVSASFISLLLRASVLVETTVACRVDLERRMGTQLGRAGLDDVMIPTYSSADETLYDVDALQRIVAYHLESELQGRQGNRFGVGELLESCMAEMASDPNLSVAGFVALAKIVPDQYKVTDDGVYRAVDVFLKAHPAVSDSERKKVCRVMNCRRLSDRASAHAALNERLPIHTAVQVLFNQQRRLQALVSESLESIQEPITKPCLCSTDNIPAAPELERMISENRALKLENLELKNKLEEKEQVRLPDSSSSPLKSYKPGSLRRKSFVNSVSKRLGWFYPFAPIGPTVPATAFSAPANPKAWNRRSRARRHSLS